MELRLDEVVALVGGTLFAGDPSTRLNGVATLEEAGSSDLTFFGVAKYRKQFEETKAGAVLVTRDVTDGPEGVGLIQVDDPSLALAALAQKAVEVAQAFEPGVRPGAFVDSSAQVDETAAVQPGAVVEAGAIVGAGTEICAGAVIGKGAKIGANCRIYQNATVREGCILGDRVILQPGVVVGSDGFGYVFAGGRHQKVPQIGIVVVEDDVEIGANSCIDRARFGKTIIGEGTKIDNLVQIAHNVQIGKHCVVVALSGVAGSSKLNDHVTLGAQVGINGHIEIAEGVRVAGQSGVQKSITEPGDYFGLPAKPLKEEIRIWRSLSKLPEVTKQVKQLRKDVDELQG